DTVELDRRRHDQAVQVDLALDQAAVLVGRVAQRDVHGPERLLGLGDLVTDPGGRVEPDADLADVVGIADFGQDGPQARGGRAALDGDGAAVPDRDRDRRLEGSEVRGDPFPYDDALGRALERWQRDLAARERRDLAGVPADPGQPRHRRTPRHRRS